MPHTVRLPARRRPRPRTATALLAAALAGCAAPRTPPVQPSSEVASAPGPERPHAQRSAVAASLRGNAGPEGRAIPADTGARNAVPPGEAVVVIAPLDAGGHEDPLPGAADEPLARGLASWYGPQFQGRRTASGERYDMHALTAAHPSLPFGTRVRVRSVHTGKEVVVRINDRGPYRHQRIIDLSLAAITALGLRHRGVTEVVLLRE